MSRATVTLRLEDGTLLAEGFWRDPIEAADREMHPEEWAEREAPLVEWCGFVGHWTRGGTVFQAVMGGIPGETYAEAAARLETKLNKRLADWQRRPIDWSTEK